ncbi:hypothetical protein L207DRAFT_562081 [Hyaloscypha variabilis F]|uniref:Uncharacterized protein n=1 Tax=Hyaloscypha variabilis (strain UAMH 11265 / GT02V1 / F) TaxID=1149755 RepID=A0A2J6S7V4_HYAVF|nr:hypothetical protein L207DRAFT_562081 [Hyaloscypha variabilis F]
MAHPNQGDAMSPLSAGGSNISYAANVNRQKTRKWAEAKPANYGGDDWGDDDDYDYDPAPAPVAKPTGLRQQGQALQNPAKADSPSIDSKKYGDLPALPAASNSNTHNRSHSFDPEDEKRNFSSNTVRQPSPPTTQSPSNPPPATRFSQTTGVVGARSSSGPPLQISTQSVIQPPTGLRKSSQVVSPVSGSPHPDTFKATRGNTGEDSPAGKSSIVSPTSDTRTPSSDYQARRDYSPSAVPPPLTTRSPAPQSATDSSATRFPPRKSSMSQSAGPDLADITGPPQAQPAPKPWTAPRPSSPGGGPRSFSPGAAARSPAAPASKALPFIRPADIYRRMEEERERERQSLDSGRPSMDSIMGTKATERAESPAKSNIRDSSSDSLGQRRSRTSLDSHDGSESGRQRPTTLEPVKERKSEYGFEGFNAQDHIPQEETEPTTSEQDRLDVEEARRFSTSPKLPDLNRISGFGMDLFSQSKPEDDYSSPAKDKEITPTAPPTSNPTSAPTDEFNLQHQPTFGFRSVVNQAFDRTDDSSVPNTPASLPTSGVSRSVSESTGTDGISPIMSRVPSAAVRGGNRDPSNPSMLEVVNEPDSPEEPQDHDEAHQEDVQAGPQPGFKPGYRREISTPSRENSPARHPDVAKTNIITSGQHAVVSETSPDEEPLQAPRPIADREQSFRPALPGGWTSYATTNSDAPIQAPIERKQTPVIERKQTPVIEAPPVHQSRKDDDYDITPTTTRNQLPQSASGAALVGALGSSAAGAALGKHDKTSRSGTPVSESSRVFSSGEKVSTPSQSTAPAGNLYSTPNVDPRALPKLEQAPQETQLRPDVVNRPESDESGVAPPPLPKDTPKQESSDNDSDYFPKPTVPLKQRTIGEVEPLEPPHRPDMIPTLSSDTRSYDEENDKLRKEIVKSLSRPTTADKHRGSMLVPGFDDNLKGNQGRESTYLPSEYDNYWASTGEDEEPVPAVAGSELKQGDLDQSENVSPVVTERSAAPELDSPVIPPLSPRRPEPSSETLQRPSLPQRFSWEEGSEEVVIAPTTTDIGPDHGLSEPTRAPEPPIVAQPITGTGQGTQRQPSPASSGRELEGVDNRVEQKTLSDLHVGRDAALVAGGTGAAALAGAAVANRGPTSPPHERRLSLAEEKDPRISSYPVSPTPPEEEHPANSPTPYLSPFATQFSQPPSSVSAVSSPIKAPTSPSGGKLFAFKDIVSIQSSQQRIQTFDETRHRWANMDSGLNDWMAKLQSQYPEHANASGSWAGSRTSAPVGSARSKFGKAAGSAAQPLQEPYYRQYLNASPTTPSTPTTRGPSPGAPSLQQSGSQLGFSPAGNKLSTQQVQAKGKEFLHSAGVFGGKAGKAGKGLLAKGKNKLRGAGGGDKETPPPKPKAEKPEKPEKERRSSWGLPLSLPRSSGRPDSRPSKDSTPNATPERSRVQPDMILDRSLTAPQLPPLASDPSLGSMSGALPAVDSPLRGEPSLSQEVLGVDDAAVEEESRDTLNVPAPIGKYQPSWDPFNATPIAEEEGFQYEERPNPPRQLSSESAPRQTSLTVPRDSISKSDRSNSSDAHFYDAHEEQAENDWVMVPDKDVVVKDQTKAGEEVRPDVEADPKESSDAPVTSILNRPRGSSYGVPSPPPSARSATFATSSSPAPTSPPARQTSPAQVQTAPLASTALATVTAPVQPQPDVTPTVQPEQQAPGILPPIRRTSTFGLSLASKKVRQKRFPIEEDDDDEREPVPQQKALEHHEAEIAVGAGAAAGIAAAAHHEQKKDIEVPAPKPSEILASKPAKPQVYLPTQPSQPTTTAIKSALDIPVQTPQSPVAKSPRQPVPPIDTTVQHQAPVSQASTIARPPLMQAGSSEYSSPSTRPPLDQAGSSEYSQRTVTSIPLPQQQPQQQPPRFGPSRPGDVAFRPQNVESSHVEWKPNRPKAAPAPAPVSASSTWGKEQDMGPPPRNSMDAQSHRRQNSYDGQRTRGYSGSSQSYGKNLEDYGDKTPYVASPIQQKPFEQPPSAAQRYPELFRPENQSPSLPRDSEDLPAHYYQEPLGRAAFLPRHQTNEYQLPGVGPPEETLPTPTKRGSGFFRDIGGRLSRGSSRERGGSISRDTPIQSPSRPFQDRATEYAESEISDAAVEQKKRRSGFFSGMKRNSTSGLGAPVSQESVIAHPPSSQMASRTDLLATPQQSPVTQHERKRSIFGSHSAEPKTKTNRLVRVSTGNSGSNSGAPNSAPVDKSEKKQRFSGLSGKLFGKSSPASKEQVQERPQATRELPYADRQPLESPGLSPGMSLQIPAQAQTPSPQAPPSQPRTILSRFNSSSPSPSPRQEAKQESKSRKASTSGILGGLMGRRPQQQERMGSDSSRSGGGSQSNLVPHALPAAQTYSDLQQQEQQQLQAQQQYQTLPPQVRPPQQKRAQPPRDIQFQDPSIPTPDRGRRVSREPQYDQVPIPGGYDLVRGQGAMVAPSGYDPRGYNVQQADPRYTQQVDPRYAQPRAQGFYNQPQGYPQQDIHQYQNGPPGGPVRQPKPNLSPIETYNSATRRLSREDLLARSPPKSPEGQQRPYQLSLPDEDEARPAPLPKDIPIFPTPPSALKHDAIQRLQQPTLRHPESPAGYPLPDDTVFSPINPIASQLPPPPAPRWPGPQSSVHTPRHERVDSLTQSLSTMDIDLQRSNTRRTAVSAVSGISDPQHPLSIHSARGSLNVPGRNGHSHLLDEETVTGGVDRHTSVLRSSPSPPSPMGSREVSPEPSENGHVGEREEGGDRIKNTTLEVKNPNGSGEDLYSASPRLPKVERFPSDASKDTDRAATSSKGVALDSIDTSDGLGLRGAEEETQPVTSGLGRGQGSTIRREVLRQAQGEKIPVDEEGQEIDVPVDENAPPSMSATSYPGQEWNPYAAGGWEEYD